MPASKLLYVATGVALVLHVFAYLATLVLPIAAPVIAEELGMNAAFIGAYAAFQYSASMAAVMVWGGLFQRFGPLRVSQVALLVMAVGLALAAPGAYVLFALSGLAIGAGSAEVTPAGSHMLTRYCPPRYAPLFFSIKQTGVPIGGMLAGFMVPFLVVHLGWRGAFFTVTLLCLALAAAFQPLRATFDDDRQPGHRLSLADVKTTLKVVTINRGLRELAFAGFTFVGLQVCFHAFFVTYLVKGLGWPLTTAGSVFAVSQGIAIFTRILWGWIAANHSSPRSVLAGLGFTMTAASVVMGLYTPAWSFAAVMAVAIVFSATAISWHGVLLAEVARLAPASEVGPVTGGVLVFIYVGMVVYPLVFGAILGFFGSFAYGFFVGAVPALIAGLLFLRPAMTDAGGGAQVADTR